MTGAFVRVCRDGEWNPIEFDQLTEQELLDFADQHPEDGWRWAKFLAGWIRDNVKESGE